MSARIILGDCREQLAQLSAASVHCIVTSPPYWGLRDYGVDGQIGLEENVQSWVDELVAVFREARRVLRDDGTLWLNLGDSYVGNRGQTQGPVITGAGKNSSAAASRALIASRRRDDASVPRSDLRVAGLKPKNLVGQPWRVAFALQDDGWYLRQDIIWSKPNPMPESIRDRCTKAHEYLFLLSKSERYHYDFEAMQEPVTGNAHARHAESRDVAGWASGDASHEAIAHASKDRARMEQGLRDSTKFGRGAGWRGNGVGFGRGFDADPKPRVKSEGTFADGNVGLVDSRNRRSVWSIPTEAYGEAHFATFPRALVRPCILAGCPVGGTVLDPFNGSGTTGQVALELGRSYVGIELNPDYVALTEKRLAAVTPGLRFDAPESAAA